MDILHIVIAVATGLAANIIYGFFRKPRKKDSYSGRHTQNRSKNPNTHDIELDILGFFMSLPLSIAYTSFALISDETFYRLLFIAFAVWAYGMLIWSFLSVVKVAKKVK